MLWLYLSLPVHVQALLRFFSYLSFTDSNSLGLRWSAHLFLLDFLLAFNFRHSTVQSEYISATEGKVVAAETTTLSFRVENSCGVCVCVCVCVCVFVCVPSWSFYADVLRVV